MPGRRRGLSPVLGPWGNLREPTAQAARPPLLRGRPGDALAGGVIRAVPLPHSSEEGLPGQDEVLPKGAALGPHTGPAPRASKAQRLRRSDPPKRNFKWPIKIRGYA